MAKQQKRPVVVAELGRPETPAETAARKAHDSRMYRQRKTVNNLVFSLLVSLAVVLIMVLVVPRGTDTFSEHSVDVQQLAAEAAPSAGRKLAAPEVPAEWKAKSAGLRQGDGVTWWQINYTTVDPATGAQAYAAVAQAFTADGSPVPEAWVSQQLEKQAPTGTERLGGLDWVVYDHPDRNPDESNMLFGMQSEWEGDTILVYGTDSPATLRVLATHLAGSLDATKEQ
ncbi:DUF4245 family protein [Leucobacter massiliensis]|uniref:DUF4245 domain-containing protein n=1 Tax=Leucobacter massiliensis TaxID=1686285 RepID=A0A2S9QSI6_9MICO|nr:DUF4245 family protein [Leucobacter massiliensis]PRI12557.1 hypothetical protein B4915_00360 [Leucobacter massiliensis]PRI12574.1 hypothetical protein B4915_00465 [Leucobacter massiliensis]